MVYHLWPARCQTTSSSVRAGGERSSYRSSSIVRCGGLWVSAWAQYNIDIILCYVMFCYVMLCYIILFYFILYVYIYVDIYLSMLQCDIAKWCRSSDICHMIFVVFFRGIWSNQCHIPSVLDPVVSQAMGTLGLPNIIVYYSIL